MDKKFTIFSIFFLIILFLTYSIGQGKIENLKKTIKIGCKFEKSFKIDNQEYACLEWKE